MNLLTEPSKTFTMSCQEIERHGPHSRPLGFSITESEISKAAIKLKNTKSPFSDKTRNEMVKDSLDILMPVFEKSLN